MNKAKFIRGMVFTCVGVSLSAGSVQAATGADELDAGAQQQSAAAIAEYWTPEAMDSAQPMPIPTKDTSGVLLYDRNAAPLPADANPGYMPGWSPQSGLAQPTASDAVEITEDSPFYSLATGAAQPAYFGTAPTNPKDGPYAPFQRYTHFGKYTSFPRSVIGKYFFTVPGVGNFVCSASVTNKNMLTTAGHCNSNGRGTFYVNRIFCPSYNKGGVNSTRGCWSVVNSKTSVGWHTSGNPDHDYACLITATTGTVHSNSIGNVTGWAGRAWNWIDNLIMAFGYPAAAPFGGKQIIHAASPIWYGVDFRAGGQVSHVIGSDMTGGSSGGPWFLSWNHSSDEYADTDGSGVTDPANTGGPHITGVNSHKRCAGGTCMSPPTTTAGVFWQEMTSPPFRGTAAADESEDIFAVCLANGGT